MSIIDLRDQEGLEPLAISSLMARLGTSDQIELELSYKPLIENFDFAKFGRGTPKFDTDELERLNTQIIHQLSFADVKDKLHSLGLLDIDEQFWLAVRPNLSRLLDIKEWWQVAKGPIEPLVSDQAFAEQAISLMPSAPWTTETWKNWTDAIKSATGRKGKDLFMPLRQALTGMDHGPELQDLLPLIGPEKAKARLQNRAA
jgi:glutamyl-tRNA synthetase